MTSGSRAVRLGDVLTIAVWTALGFGLVEGVLLDVSRSWPKVLAPYKASAHLLWVAPLVDIAMFGACAAAVWMALGLFQRLVGDRALILAWGLLLFAGAATVAVTLRVISPISAVLLAAGVSVAICRSLRGREAAVTLALRRRLVLVPIVLVVLCAGVLAWQSASERWRYGQLPAAPAARPR
jgi:hypothetical protein